MSKKPYYRCDEMLPPLNVRVNVLWDGRLFKAARVRHPQTKTLVWATQHKRETVFLPLSRDEKRASMARAIDKPVHAQSPWAGFHTLDTAAPDYWSPEQPDAWALPVPVAHFFDTPPPGTLYYTERQRFQAVDDAEAEDLAREMEHDRADARAARGVRLDEPRANKRLLWWMDITKVRYAPAGQVTRKDAEGRLMRALANEVFSVTAAGEGLGHGNGPLGRLSPEDLTALADFEAKYPAAFNPPFKALPADYKDSNTALSWFLALGTPQTWAAQSLTPNQSILVFASRDLVMSFAAIGKMPTVNLTRQRVAQAYGETIDKVLAIANGASTPGTIARTDAMTDLKARNRQARAGRHSEAA